MGGGLADVSKGHDGGASAVSRPVAEVTIPSWPTPPSPAKMDGAGYEGVVGGQTNQISESRY